MNVNDFLISFAMSVYNGEATIVNTLKSLQNQTWEEEADKQRKRIKKIDNGTIKGSDFTWNVF